MNIRSAVPTILISLSCLVSGPVVAGQPCPQDGLNLWEPQAGIPYMACHHFLTGHH